MIRADNLSPLTKCATCGDLTWRPVPDGQIECCECWEASVVAPQGPCEADRGDHEFECDRDDDLMREEC